jgi:hypothetical protein
MTAQCRPTAPGGGYQHSPDKLPGFVGRWAAGQPALWHGAGHGPQHLPRVQPGGGWLGREEIVRRTPAYVWSSH